jgi:hypothetical protein
LGAAAQVERITRNLLAPSSPNQSVRHTVPAVPRLPLLFQPRHIAVSVLVENTQDSARCVPNAKTCRAGRSEDTAQAGHPVNRKKTALSACSNL